MHGTLINCMRSIFFKPSRFFVWWCVVLAGSCAGNFTISGAVMENYRTAPELIHNYLQSASSPVVLFNPQRDRMLIYRSERHPPLSRLAGRVLDLAGVPINPQNNGPARASQCLDLRLKPVSGGREISIRLPKDSLISLPVWSPDGSFFAFLRVGFRDVSLYIGDGKLGRLKRIKGVPINAALGVPFQWLPDGKTLLCQVVSQNRGNLPGQLRLPEGPIVEESGIAPGVDVELNQNVLLEAQREVAMLDYYATSQLTLVNTESGETTPVGEANIFAGIEPSPDGQYFLVSLLQKPFPQGRPMSAFARDVQVWNRQGIMVFHLASLPVRKGVSATGVPQGPRHYHWRPTAPAELTWVEPLDGGDPEILISHRDRMVSVLAPFADSPQELFRCENRFSAMSWGEDSSVGIVQEYDYSRKQFRMLLVNPDDAEESKRLLWDAATVEDLRMPGAPLMRTMPNGQSVMRVHHNSVYLAGKGNSPSGERPFLDVLNLTRLERERIFTSGEYSHESVVALLEPDASRFITRRESAGQPPNYFVRTYPEGSLDPLTDFIDEFPELRGVHRQLINYERYDGVKLSFVLYLPPNYVPERDPTLPTIMWAYPRIYRNADAASTAKASLQRFPNYAGASHLFLVHQGFAVLDNVTLPVIGDPKKANDTFLEQIVAGARAAVDKAISIGIADPERIGVGGHSYGAFMVANLLAHTDMFRAGVARSGAYNRTLTPFGFQNERRSLWEAPETYTRISPLMFANRINEPLLLIHGAADTNPATDPLQSKRMFDAIRGNDGKARLVMLPHESHNYEALESVEHVLWEMTDWFNRHVKQAPLDTTVVMPEEFKP